MDTRTSRNSIDELSSPFEPRQFILLEQSEDDATGHKVWEDSGVWPESRHPSSQTDIITFFFICTQLY